MSAYLLYSEIKSLKKNYDFDRSDLDEFIDNLFFNDSEFTVNGYRFINEESIDSIMQQELSNDEYILGCFNPWFLADILDIDQDALEEMQKCEAYTAIGKLVLSMGKLEELQKAYASCDGYGHHFDSYNGEEEIISFECPSIPSYYVFKE